MRRIFISYRREDSAGYAIALFNELRFAFPDDVFKDTDSIPIGTDFVSAIESALLSCKVLIAIIGAEWLTDATGRRRLNDRGDFVRLELLTALKRELTILPLLVDGASMPKMSDLPDDIRPLARQNALQIANADWDHHMAILTNAIELALGESSKKKEVRQLELPPEERATLLRQKFRPLPKPTRPAPYRLSLEDVVTAQTIQTIRKSGQMVFHMAGNTGGIGKPGAQRMVALHMRKQFQVRRRQDRPAFFYHLGDIVFYWGENENYYDQFYKPYERYPGPIVGIPGNHDGDLRPGSTPNQSLAGFLGNFCAARPQLTPQAREVPRYAMTQPNPYWTFETPLATFIGLYTNVPEGGMLDTAQRSWLVSELRSAPRELPVILTMHHPLFGISRGPLSHNSQGGSPLTDVIDGAVEQSGRKPAAVFASHLMNYQRLTRSAAGQHVPYIVAGAGGYRRLHLLGQRKNGAPVKTPLRLPDTDVTLNAYCDDRHGFMRLTLTKDLLTGEYFAVPPVGNSSAQAAKLVDRFSLDLVKYRLVGRSVNESG